MCKMNFNIPELHKTHAFALCRFNLQRLWLAKNWLCIDLFLQVPDRKYKPPTWFRSCIMFLLVINSGKVMAVNQPHRLFRRKQLIIRGQSMRINKNSLYHNHGLVWHCWWGTFLLLAARLLFKFLSLFIHLVLSLPASTATSYCSLFLFATNW